MTVIGQLSVFIGIKPMLGLALHRSDHKCILEIYCSLMFSAVQTWLREQPCYRAAGESSKNKHTQPLDEWLPQEGWGAFLVQRYLNWGIFPKKNGLGW